jgi:hypothetical protein
MIKLHLVAADLNRRHQPYTIWLRSVGKCLIKQIYINICASHNNGIQRSVVRRKPTHVSDKNLASIIKFYLQTAPCFFLFYLILRPCSRKHILSKRRILGFTPRRIDHFSRYEFYEDYSPEFFCFSWEGINLRTTRWNCLTPYNMVL